MVLPKPSFNPNIAIPNNPFFYGSQNYICGEYSPFILGCGFCLDNTTSTLFVCGGGVSGVSSLTAGSGIALSASTGNITVSSTGVLSVDAGSGISVSCSGGVYTITNSCPGICTGTVTSIEAGAGLAGGTITTSGTISLCTSGVTPGVYNNANITVDAYGRITLASPGTALSQILVSGPLTNDNLNPPTLGIDSASLLVCGAVILCDAIDSTSTDKAATPNSVKTAYDLANSANTNALNASTTASNALTNSSTALSTASAAQLLATNAIPCSALTTAGDLIVGSGSSTYNILPVSGTTNGQVLTIDNGCALGMKWAAAATGSVTSVTAGDGLAGGTITSAGTICLDDFRVSETYCWPTNIEVDQFGRVTSGICGCLPVLACNFTGLGAVLAGGTVPGVYGPVVPGALSDGKVLAVNSSCTYGLEWVTPATGTGTVTLVTTGVGLTGGPISSSGSIALATSGAGAATYSYPTSISVDPYGRVSLAASGCAPVLCCTLANCGDILVTGASAALTALPLGTDGDVLTVDTACSEGVKWAPSTGGSGIPCSCITAVGDLIVGAGPSTPTTLSLSGTDGYVLTECSTASNGVLWALPTSSSVPQASPTVLGTVYGSTVIGNGVCATALGHEALLSGVGISCGSVAIGWRALCQAIGWFNVGVGGGAGCQLTSGSRNAFFGVSAGVGVNTGSFNTALGDGALGLADVPACFLTGCNNVAIGAFASNASVCGSSFNTIVGANAWCSTLGSSFVSCGNTVIGACSTAGGGGCFNTAIGFKNFAISTGCGNIMLGGVTSAGAASPAYSALTANNTVSIGSTATTLICAAVGISAISDGRDKIVRGPVPHGLCFVEQMAPKAFHYKMDRTDDTPNGPLRYGFIAQDVLKLEGSEPVVVSTLNEERLGLDHNNLFPILVNAIQELSAEVKELKEKVRALES